MAADRPGCAERDPNWAFQRIHEIEEARGGRSTHFLMAGHHHPGRRRRGRIRRGARPAGRPDHAPTGDEVGLHPSYTTSDHPERLRGRAAAAGGVGRRHRCAAPASTSCGTTRTARWPQLDALGFALDSSQGYADRPGLRAGFSFPYHPYDLASERPLGLVELPLAVMDATLSDAALPGARRRCRLPAGDRRAGTGRRGGRHRCHPLAQRPFRRALRPRLGSLLRAPAGLGRRPRRRPLRLRGRASEPVTCLKRRRRAKQRRLAPVLPTRRLRTSRARHHVLTTEET